ncbi:hypothetical protein [Actinoplanes lobatus]|uniref:Uncharacterized protein n=1 Tax=Actinoplanes lobatus TaxID=113568 RepID=A0A7W7HJE5_9ACTN|nr:hypothetical protein [Actinoplanes lobatus]MBB4751646.1 hypothetical protein [Actinoplanes lobatus]
MGRGMWPWLVGLLLGVGGFLLVANLVVSALLGGSTGAENARDEILGTEAPQAVREFAVANPGSGQASVDWLTDYFRIRGDTVLGSASEAVDVRMVRVATGDALGQPTESETVMVCLRFDTSADATWSRTSGVRARFHEIECP